jgi:hypothetical protein
VTHAGRGFLFCFSRRTQKSHLTLVNDEGNTKEKSAKLSNNNYKNYFKAQLVLTKLKMKSSMQKLYRMKITVAKINSK